LNPHGHNAQQIFLPTTVFTAAFAFVAWTIPQPYQLWLRLLPSSLYTFPFRLGSVLPFYRFHRIWEYMQH